jgi:cysteine desulfurase
LCELDEVEFIINGDVNRTMAHVVNVSFPSMDSDALMLAVRSEIAISNGSACTFSELLTEPCPESDGAF